MLCSARFQLSTEIPFVKCNIYSILYGITRDIGHERYAGFTSLTAAPILYLYAISGITNLIIMTQVIKQLEGKGSVALLLHQTEIICDILVVFFDKINFSAVANALYYGITGKQAKMIIIVSFLFEHRNAKKILNFLFASCS